MLKSKRDVSDQEATEVIDQDEAPFGISLDGQAMQTSCLRDLKAP